MNLFGKKRKKSKKSKIKKPTKSILKMCKRFKIKTTKKVGKRKVYRKISLLKKLIKKALKKAKKKKALKKKNSFGRKKTSFGRKVYRRTVKKTVKRRFRFGENYISPALFAQPTNYGYNEQVKASPGVLGQSSMVVMSPEANKLRPQELQLPEGTGNVDGVYRPFFTEQVPTTIGSNSIGFMGQPDGSMFAVGGPFAKYGFGRKVYRKRRN